MAALVQEGAGGRSLVEGLPERQPGLDHEPDRQDEDDRVERGEHPLVGLDEVAQVLDQRPGRHDEQEDQRHEDGRGVAAAAGHPHRDDGQGQTGGELVGRAEQLPQDAEGVTRLAAPWQQRHAERDEDGHGRGERDVAGQRPDPGQLTDLLHDVALQAHAGVHGGRGEADDHDGREDGGEVQRDADVVGELRDPVDEVADGPARGGGEVRVEAVPVGPAGRDARRGGKDRAGRQRALADGAHVADVLGVGLLVELLRRGAGGDQ